MSTRARIAVGVAVAAAVLAATGLASRAIEQSRTKRVRAEARRAAERAVMRARDAITSRLETLRLMSHSGASNPRLAAAVAGRVDAATYADLFASESWWEPYRGVVTVGISHDGRTMAFKQGVDLEGLDLIPLVEAVRATGRPDVRILPGKWHPSGVAVAPVQSPGQQRPSVLVFSKRFDHAAIKEMAVRIDAPILLSDGKAALNAAGKSDEVERLGRAVGHEHAGVFFDEDVARVAVAHKLIPDLWLWIGGDASAFAKEEVAADRTRMTLLWIAAAILAAAVLIASGRRRRVAAVEPRDADAVPVAVPPVGSGAVSGPQFRTPPQGLQLGRYFLFDRIGEGGMAEVFSAVSYGASGFRRSFVIKRLRPEMAGNKEAVSQFIDEANLASSLVHPNIVPVFDFVQEAGEYFIAEEYVVGRDLGRVARRMAHRGEWPLAVNAVLFVAHEVLSALEYAHNRRDDDGTPLGIVHRDVTPENIMVSRRGEVKLLDFGIVKATQRHTRTDIGMVKGNVDYMAPEQARGRAVDHRADLFSVGLVVYFLAAGKPLYAAETLYDRLTKAASGPGPEEIAAIDALPEPLFGILRRALALDPDERYATAEEFRSVVAPHMQGGSDLLARTMERVFGDELQLEQDRLAAAFPRPRPSTEEESAAP